jgi:hypothetical protein
LLVLAAKNKYRVVEVPISHFSRTVGESKFGSSPFKLLRGFYDLLAVKLFLMHKNS